MLADGSLPNGAEGFAEPISLETPIGGLLLFDLRDGTSRVLAAPSGPFEVGPDGRFGVGITVHPDLIEAPDQPSELVRFSLEGGGSQTLRSHGTNVSAVTLDPTGTLVATASQDGTVRVGPVSGDEPHLLFGHEGWVETLAFSPDGRWLASGGWDHTIRLWPVPDLSKAPLHKRPYQDVLAVLRSRTNLRSVADPRTPSGYRIEAGPFPGWASAREW